MKWSENLRVSSHDTDINDIVRPSLVLRYMQEAANQQLHTLGPSNEQLRGEGKAYILSRVAVVNRLPLHKYENITAQSWACESRHTSFNRCGRVLRNGEIVAELASVWALIDINDHHLYRVDETTVNYDTDEQLDIPLRFHIPKELELKAVGERNIGYGDVDINRHMNNTNYPDMLVNCIGSMDGMRVESFTISYMNEAALGEKITIMFAQSSDNSSEYFFRTLKSNGDTGVEAKFILTNIIS